MPFAPVQIHDHRPDIGVLPAAAGSESGPDTETGLAEVFAIVVARNREEVDGLAVDSRDVRRIPLAAGAEGVVRGDRAVDIGGIGADGSLERAVVEGPVGGGRRARNVLASARSRGKGPSAGDGVADIIRIRQDHRVFPFGNGAGMAVADGRVLAVLGDRHRLNRHILDLEHDGARRDRGGLFGNHHIDAELRVDARLARCGLGAAHVRSRRAAALAVSADIARGGSVVHEDAVAREREGVEFAMGIAGRLVPEEADAIETRFLDEEGEDGGGNAIETRHDRRGGIARIAADAQLEAVVAGDAHRNQPSREVEIGDAFDDDVILDRGAVRGRAGVAGDEVVRRELAYASLIVVPINRFENESAIGACLREVRDICPHGTAELPLGGSHAGGRRRSDLMHPGLEAVAVQVDAARHSLRRSRNGHIGADSEFEGEFLAVVGQLDRMVGAGWKQTRRAIANGAAAAHLGPDCGIDDQAVKLQFHRRGGEVLRHDHDRGIGPGVLRCRRLGGDVCAGGHGGGGDVDIVDPVVVADGGREFCGAGPKAEHARDRRVANADVLEDRGAVVGQVERAVRFESDRDVGPGCRGRSRRIGLDAIEPFGDDLDAAELDDNAGSIAGIVAVGAELAQVIDRIEGDDQALAETAAIRRAAAFAKRDVEAEIVREDEAETLRAESRSAADGRLESRRETADGCPVVKVGKDVGAVLRQVFRPVRGQVRQIV